MADGLSGFTQGLARGTAQLPEVVNQDRARQQQQSQFDTQVNLQKEDQTFRKEQAALDEKHKAMADELALYKEALVRDPSGKLTFDPTSPQGQRLDALVRKEKADATVSEVNAGNAPELGKLGLAKAKADVTGAEADASVASEKARLGLRSLKEGVKGQELQNTKTGLELKNYFADRALDRFGKGVQIAATMAGTEATRRGMKINEDQNNRANREANFQRFTAIFDRVSNEKHFDATMKADLQKFYGSAAQDEAKAVASFQQQYIENLSTVYGAVTDIPQEERDKAAALAQATAPKLRQAAGTFSTAIMDHPEAAPLVAQMTAMLKDYTRAAMSDGKVDDADAQRINDLVDVKMKELSILMDKTQSLAPQPTTPSNTGPVVGVNDGTKVAPPPETTKRGAALKPKPSGPVSLERGKQGPDLARQAKDAAYTRVQEAFGMARSDWSKQRLNEVVGAASIADAVDILNRKNPGHWALGPNNEIVELPWVKDFYTPPKGAWEANVYGANPQAKLDKLSKNYADVYAEAIKEGVIDPGSLANDPKVVQQVVDYALMPRESWLTRLADKFPGL